MAVDARRVAVFGPTGTIGRAVLAALIAAGHAPLALGRTDPKMACVPFIETGFDAQTLGSALARADACDVISCLASRTGAAAEAWAIDHAAHMAILAAAEQADVQRFVLLSAICVQKPRLAFQHAKLAFEAALTASPLAHSIVRPTALFKSLSGQLARVQAGKPYLMFGDGALTSCKPISDRDLAQFITSCLSDRARQNAVLPIGGPGPAVTPHDMGRAMFELIGQPPKYRRVPLGLIRTIGAGLRMGGRLSPRLRAKAELAAIGHYYASESMLVWDPATQTYDAEATPEYGRDTIQDYYQALIDGTETLDLGAHAVF